MGGSTISSREQLPSFFPLVTKLQTVKYVSLVTKLKLGNAHVCEAPLRQRFKTR